MQLKPIDPHPAENTGQTAADSSSRKLSSADVLMAAAMALPGLLALPAHAENAPEGTTLSFKYLNYSDSQNDSGNIAKTGSGSRMTVNAPALGFSTGIGESWGVDISGVYDSVSGASPLYHSTLSGASGKGIKDERKAADAKLTRYFSRSSVGFGVAYSTEHDYTSRAVSLDYRIATDDNNTTFAMGTGYSSDRIQDSNGTVILFFGTQQKKRSNDFMVGVTHNLTANDIIQSNITYATGKGYFDDPYKQFDKRPDSRNDLAWLTRINHYYNGADATLNFTYRYFTNSWGMRAQTFETEWRQQLPRGWMVIPALRYYTQNSADFYSDLDIQNTGSPANLNTSYPGITSTNYADKPFYTADSRLSAFGAITPGFKIRKEFSKGEIADLKLEFYQQRASWRLGGEGSPGIEPWKAYIIQAGYSKTF
jgi:Protein of unknown function (DUF3570)